MPVCTNHPLIFYFYIHRTWRGCIRGVDWSQIKAALSCLHLYGLTAVSGLSIFNNKDGRQVNCCFRSYSCVSQQTKKLNYCLSQDDFSWRSPSAWWVVERKIAHFLQSISFYTVFNKGKLAFNNNLHWQAICHPFCPVSVQPPGRTGLLTPHNADLGFDILNDRHWWQNSSHDTWPNILAFSYSEYLTFTSTHTTPEFHRKNISRKHNK